MRINLDYYEIIEALENYVKEKHNLKISLNDCADYPYLDATQRIYQTSKDNDGNNAVDVNKTTHKPVTIEINDTSEISIFI